MVTALSCFSGSVKCQASSMGNDFQVTIFKIEGQRTSNLLCTAQNGPILIWVVHLGLRGCSRWSLGSVWAFSEHFWTYSPKVLEKAKTLPQDHLEHPLRPRWTTQIRIGPFWAVHKRFEVLWPSFLKMVTWKPFPIEEAWHFTEPLKQLCTIVA